MLGQCRSISAHHNFTKEACTLCFYFAILFDVSPLHVTPIHRFSQTALSNLLIISLMLGHLPELDWTTS